MKSAYYRNLIKTVLDSSESDTWEEAVREWDICDCEEDKHCSSFCICGKEHLKYLYTIRNRKTRRILYPIGSSCIKKFERDDMEETIKIQEGMFKLYSAIQDGERIELSTRFFSKKILLYLYRQGAFKPTRYNHYNGEEDYQFLLDMFNKRNKNEITELQQRKIRAIIAFSIKPFLQRNLKYKE